MYVKHKYSGRCHFAGFPMNLCSNSIHVLRFNPNLKLLRHSEPTLSNLRPIIVYVIDRHPLEVSETGPFFRWLHFDNDFKRELKDLIGPYDPDQLNILIDEEPAGSAWRTLLDHLLREQVELVVTHLAPLSPAQRQQLIGVCAQVGAQLITPSDAGRNRENGKKK